MSLKQEDIAQVEEWVETGRSSGDKTRNKEKSTEGGMIK